MKDLLKRPVADDKPSADKEALIRTFVEGAPITATRKRGPYQKTKSRSAFKRVTFSLSENVEQDILKLSRMPRDFTINKSQVVRAGILALREMDRTTLLELLERVAKGDAAQSDGGSDSDADNVE